MIFSPNRRWDTDRRYPTLEKTLCLTLASVLKLYSNIWTIHRHVRGSVVVGNELQEGQLFVRGGESDSNFMLS